MLKVAAVGGDVSPLNTMFNSVTTRLPNTHTKKPPYNRSLQLIMNLSSTNIARPTVTHALNQLFRIRLSFHSQAVQVIEGPDGGAVHVHDLTAGQKSLGF